jgi:serine/threonine protein kinase
MFKDEAHIGQRLQHANIVKVEGFDIIQGSPSIIMEFIDGSDLRAVLSAIESKKTAPGKRNSMPSGLCAYIIAEAARGLHYAHTRYDDLTNKPLNIVHRDISPQNLLISWEGEVKITDFGIAAADRDFKQTETKAGIVKGKYSYMSPEQISGKKCDPKTDIFALSVVMWEMLALRRLFTADNEIEVIELVRHCRIPGRLKDFNPNVSDELESIVMRGLHKDPRKRYESMESLEKTLRAYLSKNNPTISGADLSSFVKDYLSDKRELAQEEMRKILTSTQLPVASPNNSSASKVREFAFDEAHDSSSLKLGKTSGPKTINNNPISQGRSIQSHRPGPQHAAQGYRTQITRSSSVMPRKKANNTPFYAAIALLIAGIAGGVAFKNHNNAAKQGLMLTLRTSPSPVQIQINDRTYDSGKYFTSPLKLKLDPGLNIIEISRPGYLKGELLINTDEGMPRRTPSVRLQPSAVFAPVRLNYKGSDTVIAVINDGFFRASMSPQQSIEQVNDITSNTTSKLLVFGKDRKVIVSCQFTPTATTGSRPLIIKFGDAGSTCEFSSPQRTGGQR